MVKIEKNMQLEFDRCAGVVYTALRPFGISFSCSWGGYCDGKVMGVPPHMIVELGRKYEGRTTEIVKKLEDVERFLDTKITLRFAYSDKILYGVD